MVITIHSLRFCIKISERQFLHLAAVLEGGGVSEGAALIGLSQLAVSRSIAEMERRLDEPLFNRDRRPMEPTALGRMLGLHGEVILNATRKAAETADAFRSGRAGVVRAGGVPFFMDAMISTMIAGFCNANPGIRVDQSNGCFHELRAHMAADQIDLPFCPVGVHEPGSGLSFREILPARNVLACRAGHPLLRQRRLAATDMLDFPWIAPQPGSPLLGDLHAILLALGMAEVKVSHSCGSLMAVMNVLAETDALTILPHSVVFAFRAQKRVTVLPVEIPQPERALGILRSSETPARPAADRFADHVAREFEALRHLIKRHESAIVRVR
jgi:DNA-binding transcriptional LysR family regulator